MAVVITQAAYGKKVGETYTGPHEAALLADGKAKREGYTGPGVAGTGPADVPIADNPEFNKDRPQIAETSDTPRRGVNDGLVLKTPDAPTTEAVGRRR